MQTVGGTILFNDRASRKRFIKVFDESFSNAVIGRAVGLNRSMVGHIRSERKINISRAYIDATCPTCGKERRMRKDNIAVNPKGYCNVCSKKVLKSSNNKYYVDVTCAKCGKGRAVRKEYVKMHPLSLCRSCSKKGKPSTVENVIHKPLEKISVDCTVCGKQMIMGRKAWIKGKKRCRACTVKIYGILERGLAIKRELYSRYVSRSKKRKINFTLSFDTFVELTSQHCFYCGTKPSNITVNEAGNGDYVSNGIDRVDNNKGYIEDNVVPCCKVCNYAKNTMSLDQFYSWISRVNTNLSSKGVLNGESLSR